MRLVVFVLSLPFVFCLSTHHDDDVVGSGAHDDVSDAVDLIKENDDRTNNNGCHLQDDTSSASLASSPSPLRWLEDSSGIDISTCTIPRVHGCLTSADFQGNFTNYPVILVGCVDNHAIQAATQRGALLETFATHTIILSSANTYSHDKRKVPFETYLNEIRTETLSAHTHRNVGDKGSRFVNAKDKWYHFGDNNHQEWAQVLSLYHAPPHMGAPLSTGTSFGIGAGGSGVPFHLHGPVFAEVFHGKKRWFLSPPDLVPSFHPEMTSLDWYHNVYPTLAPHQMPLDCTVGAGETIFIPDKWWHSTLNLGETVFLATFV